MRRFTLRNLLSGLITGSLILNLGFGSLLVAQTAEPDEDEAYVEGLVGLELDELLEHFLAQVEAEDPVHAALLRIAAERHRIERTTMTASAREAAVMRMIESRRALIEANPFHPRRALWLADQAQDCLERMLPIDASGLTTLYGFPTPRQRRIALQASRTMFEAAASAEREIGKAILDLESRPGFRDDVALQNERRRLVEEERDGRIAYFRGISAYLRAELDEMDAPARNELLRLAASRLEPLAERLDGEIARQARLFAGRARGRLGEYEASSALFQAVIDDAASPPVDRFAARMGFVFNRMLRSGTESALSMLDDLETAFARAEDFFYRVLIADQRFLLTKRLAEMDDSFSAVDAYDAYLELLSLHTDVPANQVQAIVFARLVNAAGEDAPLDRLPALVTVARAAHLAREKQGLSEAINMLEAALGSGRLDADERPLVLFELGKALHLADRRLEAVGRLTELARDHPRFPQAERAIELAVTIAESMQRSDPSDREVHDALQEAVNVLLTSYPNLPSIDHWRYAAGRLALVDERYDQAISLFRQVSPNAPEWADSLFMRAATARARAQASLGKPEERLQHQSVIDVIRDVRPSMKSELAATLDENRQRDLRYYLGFLLVFEAEAQLDLGHPQFAIDALEGIDSMPDPDAKVIAEALQVRISAEQQAGRPDMARQAIGRFIQTAPEQVEPVIVPMLHSLQAGINSRLEDSGPDEALEHARQTLLPILEALRPWIEEQANHMSIDLQLQVADAYRSVGDYDEAMGHYERALRLDSNGLQPLFGKAECQFFKGGEDQLIEAMIAYRRIAAAGQGSSRASRDYYWSAQLRMLQILDQTGRNTDRIVPRIRQLRQIDRELGGTRFRREFERLQNRHS